MTDIERAEKVLRDFNLADKEFRKVEKEWLKGWEKAVSEKVDKDILKALKATRKVK